MVLDGLIGVSEWELSTEEWSLISFRLIEGQYKLLIGCQSGLNAGDTNAFDLYLSSDMRLQ
jgi:hypothetical protein